MRLYPKKLRSVKELHQEKQRLLKKTAQLDNEEFLSAKGLMGKGGDGGGGGSLLDMLPISNPVVGQVIKMVAGRLSKKAKEEPKEEYRGRDKGEKKESSLLKRAAIEFIGGYLKWKAIELSYKGVKHLIKKRRAAREEEY